jgi:hypothetical protein
MDSKAWVDENERRRFVRLYEYVAALEVELARWTFKYGMTEEAFRLLSNSPSKEMLSSVASPSRPRQPSNFH